METSNPDLILVVDDSEDNRRLLRRIVRKAGFAVIEASGGLEAIQSIMSYGQAIDVVLLDWMMPEISGVDVLRRARESFNTDELPIIMCTARDEGEAVSAALAEGANDYITKPINQDVLLARVSAQIDRKKAESEKNTSRAQLENTLFDRTTELSELKRNSADLETYQIESAKLLPFLEGVLKAADNSDMEQIRHLVSRAIGILSNKNSASKASS